MSSSSRGASRFASSLETNLGKLWIKLMGR
jgi:hypothetical protein